MDQIKIPVEVYKDEVDFIIKIYSGFEIAIFSSRLAMKGKGVSKDDDK